MKMLSAMCFFCSGAASLATVLCFFMPNGGLPFLISAMFASLTLFGGLSLAKDLL